MLNDDDDEDDDDEDGDDEGDDDEAERMGSVLLLCYGNHTAIAAHHPTNL